MIDWATANEQRVRVLSGVRFGFGVLVLILGLTVYRAGEQQAPQPKQAQAGLMHAQVSAI
jgi:hypothetical protein